jgi:hypothetical protein
MQVTINGRQAFLCAGGSREPVTVGFDLLKTFAGVRGKIPTISYATPDGRNGELTPGGRVTVEHGMSFNVIVTNGA